MVDLRKEIHSEYRTAGRIDAVIGNHETSIPERGPC
jgi:hypothetical protein